MARKRWTLLVLSNDGQPVRQVVVTRSAVRITIAAALLLLSVLGSMAAGSLVRGNHHLRAETLARKNTLLASELKQIREQVTTLRKSLEELGKQDEHYRLLAGLDPLDEDVRKAGMGGPGTETLESSKLWRTDPALGGQTFAMASDLSSLVGRARVLNASWREATTRLERKQRELEAMPSIPPTLGYFSSAFSRYRHHPILDRPRAHEGIDISAPRGAPIVAAAKGRVIFAGRNGDYGLMVEIDHGYGYVTRYAHARRILVRTGQTVDRGQRIGEVGETGLAIGPHVHYEVLVEGRPTNPKYFIFDRKAIAD